VCGGFYKSVSKHIFTLPAYAKGCEVCVRNANNTANIFFLKPPASGVLEPSVKTALCTADYYLKDSGTAAATDYICVVASDTSNQWDTWGSSGTFTCVAAP
jgi:hypothetical protein